MSWEDTKSRNFQGVQFERIRARFDLLFARIHDALEVAYYQHWRQELAHRVTITKPDGSTAQWLGNTRRTMPAALWTWLGRSGGAQDTPITAAEAKRLFDLLHGVLWHLHSLFLAQQNGRETEPYDQDEVDPWVEDETGTPIERMSEVAKRVLRDLRDNKGVDLGQTAKGFDGFLDVTID
jgi:hypothetical protein